MFTDVFCENDSEKCFDVYNLISPFTFYNDYNRTLILNINYYDDDDDDDNTQKHKYFSWHQKWHVCPRSLCDTLLVHVFIIIFFIDRTCTRIRHT